MRKIEFDQLKLKSKMSEEEFYKIYLKEIELNDKKINVKKIPQKSYELVYLNILDGKIIIIESDYINYDNIEEQELFYDYGIAKMICSLTSDIYEGIEFEQNEFNELYRTDRLEKDKEIQRLTQIDDLLFQEYKKIYNEFMNLESIKNYEGLKAENEKLKEELRAISEYKKDNIFVRIFRKNK